MFTKDFAKLIFQGKKKLLKLDETKQVNVTKFEELSVKGLYEDLIQFPGMKDYFPGSYPKGRCCSREYMFNVANTLHPKVVGEILQHAHEQRHGIEKKNEKDEAIMMSDHWRQELASLPLRATVSDILTD